MASRFAGRALALERWRFYFHEVSILNPKNGQPLVIFYFFFMIFYLFSLLFANECARTFILRT